MGEPPGGVPVTEAMLVMLPASRSAWVVMCVAVHVVVALGASDVTGHEIPVALGSVTVIEFNVTAPVFRTANVYGTLTPTAVNAAVVVPLRIDNDDAKGVLVSVHVISSPAAGVTVNGTVDEPAMGSVVVEPDVAFTHVTARPY
jgi:hypothetical protein